ncbi:MAG: hypothetical protein JXP34_26780 [Planctomycetes bacterium]|nr:hypothetical protein [Planctomycetota bacterium]
MRVIGIDPASHVTGIAVIDDGKLVHSSTIVTKPPKGRRAADSTWARLQLMVHRIRVFVSEWRPDVVAVEVTRPISYQDVPQIKGRFRTTERGGHRGIDNVIVYKQTCGAAVAAVGLAVRARAIVIHLDVDDWKKRKHKCETLFEAASIYNVPLLEERRHDTDRADAIMIAHTAWSAWLLAQRARMDYFAYCTRAFTHSQVWTPRMLTTGGDE